MYAEIVARLAALEVASGGSGRFQLGTPTGEEELRAFEAAHGIQLPEEYRSFLLAVGQAAPGPEYGFLTLEAAMAERGESIYGLADPFPSPSSSLELLAFDVGGVLPLTYDGCDFFKGLVVSGPARGTVWFNVPDRPGWVPDVIAAVNDKGKPLKVSRGDYHAYYDQLLAPVNRDRASSFAAFFDAWLASEEKAHGLGARKKKPKAKAKAP